MSYNIDTFIIHPATSDIFEINFGYKFCRKKIEKQWRCKTSLINGDESIADLKSSSDKLIFFLDPLSVPSANSKLFLQKALDSKFAVAFATSQFSSNIEQLEDSPPDYINFTTFDHFSEKLNYGVRLTESDSPDPFLFAVDRRKVPQDIPINKIFNNTVTKCIVKGAFVHRFGNVFEADRADLFHLIPEESTNLLDIGCASGNFGKRLKEIRGKIKITGVELSSELSKKTEDIYDKIITGDIEKLEIKEKFDTIICADILEHLYNPWGVVKKCYNILENQGVLIGSIPNIGHWSNIFDLINGKFEYLPFGNLCVGHIRFFTENGIRELFEESNFKIEILQPQKLPIPQFADDFIEKLKGNFDADTNSLETFSWLFRLRRV